MPFPLHYLTQPWFYNTPVVYTTEDRYVVTILYILIMFTDCICEYGVIWLIKNEPHDIICPIDTELHVCKSLCSNVAKSHSSLFSIWHNFQFKYFQVAQQCHLMLPLREMADETSGTEGALLPAWWEIKWALCAVPLGICIHVTGYSYIYILVKNKKESQSVLDVAPLTNPLKSVFPLFLQVSDVGSIRKALFSHHTQR